MASYMQLNREIRQLQNQLDEANRNCNEMRRKLHSEMEANNKKLREEFNREISRQKQLTQKEYSKRFQRLQEDILAVQTKKLQEIEKETAVYVKKQKELLAQIEAIQTETMKELEKLKKQANKDSEVARQFAIEAYDEMLQSRALADKGPHTFFHPNQFDIITQQTEKIKSEIEGRMYQSALADANATAMQYDVLSVKTNNNLNEWYRSYDQFRSIVVSLVEEIKTFLETEFDGECISKTECDFWSKGRFSRLKMGIDDAYKMISDVEEKGVIEYLRTVEFPDRTAIYSAVIQAKLWQTRLAAILGCISRERALSHERFEVGDIIAECLECECHLVELCRFRPPTDDDICQEWYVMPKDQNPFETFEVVSCFNDKDMIHINIVPVRQNGIVVRNECVVYIELETIQNDEFEKQYLKGLNDKINAYFMKNQIKMQVQIQGFLSDRSAYMRAEDVNAVAELNERLMKKTPEPDKQIQLMEKKYIF